MSKRTRPDGPTHRVQKLAPPRWLRIVIPTVLILVWLIGASLGGPLFGRVGEVSSDDRTTYLPESAEATQVQELADDFRDSDALPLFVVITSDQELDEQTLEELAAAAENLADLELVTEDVSPPLPSEDALAAQIIVPLDAEADPGEGIEAVQGSLAEDLPKSLAVHVAGPAALSADLSDAFAGIDGLLLVVALVAVGIILVIVYRSVLLPILVLSTSMFALCVALLMVWQLAARDVLLLSGQTQGILFILVIGAATDYSLLYVARYRDELRHARDRFTATNRSIKGVLEPILASGGTVIAGLLCLLLSDLRSNSTLGPVAAIGIVFAMASALTFLPALLYVTGRVAFWPRRPRFDPELGSDSTDPAEHGIWGRVAQWVPRRPRPLWILTALVLAIGCAGVLQLKADGVPQSEFVLGSSAAREGQAALSEHFPGGAGSPMQVIAPKEELQEIADLLREMDGVSDVSVTAADSPSGAAPVTADGIQPLGPPGTPAPEPTVVDGHVLLQATLEAAPDSAAAEDVVRSTRTELASQGHDALVGGETATGVDTNDTSAADRALIIPVVLVVITLILMLLLRSILAPLLLIATTVLSFGTAMGVSALVFNHLLDFPGADPAVPLYGFVFLVALGIDYNIFLMTRVREESLIHGTREGVIRGLAVTGGVISSAGIVLAATFAALSVIPILFLVQLAFIVAFGVLLDTFVVRTLLVPALVLDFGKVVWSPSALWRRGEP